MKIVWYALLALFVIGFITLEIDYRITLKRAEKEMLDGNADSITKHRRGRFKSD